MSKKAVIEVKGHQFIVSEKEKLKVDLVGDEKKLSFEPLLVIDGEKVQVGTPTVSGVKVEATVVEESVKDDKVVAIRYKSKKRVNKKRGHRQQHSIIEITKIA
ncbi:50S ribosomal protein L21 [Candidatus Nomurabacteria bacterium]|nr:50S ribosomal protein L21 [Candidatus Saccharibacteria bacterium]MCA9312831.1 50S ribosomal protein L21 [Candidatus Saccharibacteria bacterium]MCB9822270.1 50S ribosomal protein L21 [Candidatus Nomurabacteria bacterium]